MMIAIIALSFTVLSLLVAMANLIGSLRRAEAREVIWEATNKGLVESLNRQTSMIRSLAMTDFDKELVP